MDFSSIFFIAISFICLLLLTNYLLSSNNNKKKHPPSPPSLPIIGHLHLLKKPLHHTLSHLSNRYGPILLLRFGCRRVLVISSFSIAEECLTKSDIIFANRPKFPSNKYVSYNFTTIGTTNYGPRWRNLRRIATVEVFSSHRLNSFEHIRAEEVGLMVRRLFKESSSREKVYIANLDFKFSFNLDFILNEDHERYLIKFLKCMFGFLELILSYLKANLDFVKSL